MPRCSATSMTSESWRQDKYTKYVLIINRSEMQSHWSLNTVLLVRCTDEYRLSRSSRGRTTTIWSLLCQPKESKLLAVS
jgi:hypothetical protein